MTHQDLFPEGATAVASVSPSLSVSRILPPFLPPPLNLSNDNSTVVGSPEPLRRTERVHEDDEKAFKTSDRLKNLYKKILKLDFELRDSMDLYMYLCKQDRVNRLEAENKVDKKLSRLLRIKKNRELRYLLRSQNVNERIQELSTTTTNN